FKGFCPLTLCLKFYTWAQIRVPFVRLCQYDTHWPGKGQACGHEAPKGGPPFRVQGISGMARKAVNTSGLDNEVAKELEDALDIDLVVEDEPGLDMASSIADFEAQIARAAADLARDSRAATVSEAKAEKPAAEKPAAKAAAPAAKAPVAEKPQPKPAEKRDLNDLKPVDVAPSQPAPTQMSPANDDRQKDYRALQQMVRRSGSRAIYWGVTLLSLAWIAGAMIMGSMLFQPPLWEVRSVSQL